MLNWPKFKKEKTMSIKGISPSDILSDSDDYINLNGVSARKGSIAAFLKNIDILESEESSEAKDAALKMIKELAPVIIAAGLHKHAVFKNKIVQDLLDEIIRF